MTPWTCSGPSASAAIDRRERAVDTAGESEHDVGEAVLAHVVTQAQLQRFVHLFGAFYWGGEIGRGAELGPRSEVDDHQVLGERCAACDHVPAGRDHDAAAVEDQFVLTAHQVAVREPHRVLSSTLYQHLLALGALAGVKRGGRDVEQYLRARLGGLSGYVRDPDVLTDRGSQHRPAQLGQGQGLTGGEVAPLVKDPVVGKLALVMDLQDAVVSTHGDRVVERIADAIHEAHECDVATRGRHLFERHQVVLDEVLLVQQILGRIAGQAQLWEERHTRSLSLSRSKRLENEHHVALDVADR